jgi:hypothetical protein
VGINRMDINKQKYFRDVTLRFNSKFNEKWLSLIDLVLLEADEIEFNIFHPKKQLVSFINNWREEFIERGRGKDKIYSSGEYIRFKLSDRLREFVLSIKIKEWNNYGLEDVSLIRNEIEILATITHESYIYLLTTDVQADKLNSMGFNLRQTEELEMNNAKRNAH